jgi:hypothetical protein
MAVKSGSPAPDFTLFPYYDNKKEIHRESVHFKMGEENNCQKENSQKTEKGILLRALWS